MASQGRKVYVVGVGMTKFEKPQSKKWDYPDMGREAGKSVTLPIMGLFFYVIIFLLAFGFPL